MHGVGILKKNIKKKLNECVFKENLDSEICESTFQKMKNIDWFVAYQRF